jgi:hypothetical protein
MATTADQESHEWSRIQSGVFTHELLSGLSGAADVNSDGVVEYSEIQAFIASANRDIRDSRAIPRVVANAPPLNPRAPLVEIASLHDVSFLSGNLFSLGHFHIELDDGERYLDAHLSAELKPRIALPAGRHVFVISKDAEAELSPEDGQTAQLAALTFHARSASARGSIDASFRSALFQSAFGSTYYQGYLDSAGGTEVSISARLAEPAVSRDLIARSSAPAITAVAVAGGAFVTAGIAGGLAIQARNDYFHTDLQRQAADAQSRFQLYAPVSVVAAGVAVGSAVAAWLFWPGALTKTAAVTPELGPGHAGVALSAAW